MDMWTVYERPLDCPGLFVARRFVIGANTVEPTAAFVTGKNLDEVRAKLPPGLIRFPRQPGDEPQIVEVWF